MENFILNHRGLSIRAGLCCLVSERNMVVSNGVIYSMGPLYAQDVADIKGALAQIWQLQRYILSNQR